MSVSPEAVFRLRSARDCGVIRSTMGDRGFVELCQRGLVQRRYLPGFQGMSAAERCDYLLTATGERIAASLPRKGVVR